MSHVVKQELVAQFSEGGNKNRIAIVEATSNSGTIDTVGKVDIRVERFGADRQNDSMFREYIKDGGENIRTSFRLPLLFLGKSGDMTFACYDEETETLTDSGWIKRKDYRVGMKVAAVHPHTGALSFERPQALSVYDVENVSMYKYQSTRDDMMVTPRHRMLFRGLKGAYQVAPVEKMVATKRVKVRKSVVWNDGIPLVEFAPPHRVVRDGPLAYKSAPRAIPAYDFLEFLGWYVSEGHTQGTSYAVITQHPSRYLPQIRAVCRRLESRGYFLSESTLNNGCQQVKIGDYSLVKWLKEEIGEGAVNKKLPQWILNLPQSQLRTLFDAMMLGDGSVDTRVGRTSMSYSTVSPILAGQVQEIALKLGYAANVKKGPIGSYGIHPSYCVNISTQQESELWSATNCTRENYTGKVHCFTVSTGVYVTRRNGKIAVQGNTAYTSIMIAEAQVFFPERDEFDTIINNRIVRELGVKNYTFASLPMTLVDIVNQLKALDIVISKDWVEGADIVKLLNDITGLSLEFREPPEPVLPPALLDPTKKPDAVPPTDTPPAIPKKTGFPINPPRVELVKN